MDAEAITGWESFHETFRQVMGFPSFYGMNMDAWIDCMSYLDDEDARMTRFHLGAEESLSIEITGHTRSKFAAPRFLIAWLSVARSLTLAIWPPGGGLLWRWYSFKAILT